MPSMMSMEGSFYTSYYQTWIGDNPNSTLSERVAILQESSTIIQCSAHKSNYTTKFDFVNGRQTVNTNISDIDEATLNATAFVLSNFTQIVDSSNSSGSRPTTCPNFGTDDKCVVNLQLINDLSYQAIFEAFIETFIGMVHWRRVGSRERRFLFTSTSQVQSTILARSPELAFLHEPNDLLGDIAKTMQEQASAQHDAPFTGLDMASLLPSPITQTQSLGRALEELFQNITISLMGVPELQANESSIFYPEPTLVEFTMEESVYAYAATKLWLAYGLAIGVTTLIVVFACVAIMLNQASYSNDFSTWLRLSLGSDISNDFEGKDLAGEDPLPEYIENASIEFPHAHRGDQSSAAAYGLMQVQREHVEPKSSRSDIAEYGGDRRSRGLQATHLL
ncbi:hypothetical protein CKM354_000981400 [Cercospora kikuchii]|uniref:Uncharacterized protein n=1 Tax=Cercospora kikuchii TaxID=84275 RepID=A0A9P3CU59_9PEZI|nr:uncharacterized protein CKM354_000981400 [Cercospora kikuchii]GIZ46700.1 hypothetical protein CKM354_000981400 [Cercospora kikuchii]